MRQIRARDERSETVAAVCGRVSAGESVAGIFRQPEAGYPSVVTWWRWVAEDESIREAYIVALQARAAQNAEEIVEIADRGDLEPDDKRVRIDARKWIAARLLPKVYGDKINIDHNVTLAAETVERLNRARARDRLRLVG